MPGVGGLLALAAPAAPALADALAGALALLVVSGLGRVAGLFQRNA